MSDFLMASDSVEVYSIGEVLASTTGTLITASASANTKGSWAEISSSTSFQARELKVVIYPDTLTTVTDFLVDIGIGGSGSEEVLVPDILLSYGSNITYDFHKLYKIPIGVPAGSRLSMRCQASTGSSVLGAIIYLTPETFLLPPQGSEVISYGANSADSGGTQVDPGGTINTKGAYTELVSSTEKPIYAIGISVGNQLNAAQRDQFQFIDIAVGGSGSEQVIINNIFYQSNGFEIPMYDSDFFRVSIPEGSRISARSQSDANTADDRLFDIVLHCVR